MLQHVSFEGTAAIANWAKNKKATITTTKFYEQGWALPSPDSMDLLVVMGGPMGVHDDARYSWLALEKTFIKECIRHNRRVIGICLGAQLCAHALGAKVYQNAQKEIGWFPLHVVTPHRYISSMPDPLMVFHWHGDTYDLPAGAKHLAHSAACQNQMYVWHEQVLGLQFHLELQQENIEALITNCAEDLCVKSDTVQNPDKIRSGYGYARETVKVLNDILDRFTR